LRLKSLLVFILTAALVLPVSVSAQQAPTPAPSATPAAQAPPPAPVVPPAPPQPKELKLVVLQGEGARNNLKTRVAIPPVIEVRDEADKPVEGAQVVFQLPAAGPGGVFNGWMRTQTARTNAQGQAGVNGFVPNDQEGRFNIKVTATKGSAEAGAVISQSNTSTGMQANAGKRKWWKVVAVVGAGAAVGGIVAATRGGGTTPAASTSVTITPGTVTISSPR
jgi:hypothetical protein